MTQDYGLHWIAKRLLTSLNFQNYRGSKTFDVIIHLRVSSLLCDMDERVAEDTDVGVAEDTDVDEASVVTIAVVVEDEVVVAK
jgi:hypothetical protein